MPTLSPYLGFLIGLVVFPLNFLVHIYGWEYSAPIYNAIRAELLKVFPYGPVLPLGIFVDTGMQIVWVLGPTLLLGGLIGRHKMMHGILISILLFTLMLLVFFVAKSFHLGGFTSFWGIAMYLFGYTVAIGLYLLGFSIRRLVILSFASRRAA